MYTDMFAYLCMYGRIRPLQPDTHEVAVGRESVQMLRESGETCLKAVQLQWLARLRRGNTQMNIEAEILRLARQVWEFRTG